MTLKYNHEIWGMFLTGIFFINLIPGAVVGVKRLRDTNRSGWWYLIFLIPLFTLIVFYFCTNDVSKGKNRFGTKPKNKL